VTPLDIFQRIDTYFLRRRFGTQYRFVDLHDRTTSDNHRPFDDILKLSDISRPAILFKTLHPSLRNAANFLTELLAELAKEKIDQKRDILPALSERWHFQRKNVQAVEKIRAECLESAYSDRPTLFGGPAGEGLALFVKFWCEQTLNRTILRIILPDLFKCLHEKDKGYFRESREARFGTTLEQYALPAEEGVPLLRDALSPMRATLQRQPYLAGAQPNFADYIVFGSFQWARAVSPVALVEAGDPVFEWRERLLDAFGGFARSARHCGA
jgi:glutathione S-transferase